MNNKKKFHIPKCDEVNLSSSCEVLPPAATNSPCHPSLAQEKLEFSMQYVSLSVDRHWREFWSRRKQSPSLVTTCNRYKRQTYFNVMTAGVSTICIHDYEPLLYAADSSNRIWVWNYQSATKLNCFKGKPFQSKGPRVTTLKIINQLHDSLLLSGSDDGQVLIWRNAHYSDAQTVVSGFVTKRASRERSYTNFAVQNCIRSNSYAIPPEGDLKPRKHFLEWEQETGVLYSGSNILRVFDLDREQFTRDVQLQSYISTMTLDPTNHYSLVFGTLDGSINFIDTRSRNACSPGTLKIHNHRVVRTCVQGNLLHSIDPTGLFIASDIRKPSVSGEQLVRVRLKRSISSFSSHRLSPMIAIGSTKQTVSLYGTRKLSDPLRKLQHIKLQKGFLNKKGPITHLEFHRQEKIFAASGYGSVVSIFGSTAR